MVKKAKRNNKESYIRRYGHNTVDSEEFPDPGINQYNPEFENIIEDIEVDCDDGKPNEPEHDTIPVIETDYTLSTVKPTDNDEDHYHFWWGGQLLPSKDGGLKEVKMLI